ncbi:dihydroorotase [Candidatus Albibeggiatoa sp. nov. NOAA]|uniref:dihydroorotase n=1 Tax=Candidatus Albibeggiatoa sp. nov. NOAA TaxID=3162724 RepID=UPI003303FA95|nr:dihydroorotase [Thiotrichaceae bacterium]
MAGFSITGGRVIDPATGLDAIADVHIQDGKIAAIGELPEGFTADAEMSIDATGQVVCPGLVDLSVRLREPGAEHKGTIVSETRAAASAGITSLCCPPDTDPAIDTPAVAELLQQRATNAGMTKVYPLAALTVGLKGQHLAEMGDLKEAGCIGVSNAMMPVENTEVLRHAMEYAANCDLTLFVQPQEPFLGRKGCAHEGAVSTRLGLAGIPEAAETIAVSRIIFLMEITGVKVHFCRLSTARAVDMVQEAQARSLPVSADVSTHHLFLTDMDILDYDAQCHVMPPLRSQRDKDALRQGLASEAIHAICSDHQPHEPDAKLSPFAMTDQGISGIDTLLPLTLRLVEEKGWDLSKALGMVTYKPADILGLPAGRLRVGDDADICIFDPASHWQLTENNIRSVGLNTPFLNWDFTGRVSYTLINGKVVHTSINN